MIPDIEHVLTRSQAQAHIERLQQAINAGEILPAQVPIYKLAIEELKDRLPQLSDR